MVRKSNKRSHLTVVFILLTPFLVNAQYIAKNITGVKIAHDTIGDVEFYPQNNPLEFPIISLYSANPLLLKFDVFGLIDEQLVYKIEHCNRDWTKSEMDEMEYMDGFAENTFYPFSTSYNTQVDYTQYQLELPNDDFKFILTGNYIIRIFTEDKKLILERRFIVYDDETDVAIEKDLIQSDKFEGTQAVKVTVTPGSLSFRELSGCVDLVVIQNNNWQTVKTFDGYNVDNSQDLVFGDFGEISFDGTNEFRYFDIKSLKHNSEKIAYKEYIAPYYHIYLKADKLEGDKEYFSSADLSGSFYIRNQESNDDNMMDADYVWVYFTLETEIPLGEDVYIDGAFTDWSFGHNHMNYYPEQGAYHLALLLKQGIYNYRYVTLNYKNKKVYSDYTEGNFYETGNDYKAFLYYREPGGLYDQVVGYGDLFTGIEVKEYDEDEELNVIQQLLKEMAK